MFFLVDRPGSSGEQRRTAAAAGTQEGRQGGHVRRHRRHGRSASRTTRTRSPSRSTTRNARIRVLKSSIVRITRATDRRRSEVTNQPHAASRIVRPARDAGRTDTGGTMRRSFLTRTDHLPDPDAARGRCWSSAAYLKDPGRTAASSWASTCAGGTILVYEVDQELVQASRPRAATRTPPAGPRPTASRWPRASSGGSTRPTCASVIVRPVGDTRVEIILPFTGAEAGRQGGRQPRTTSRRSRT